MLFFIAQKYCSVIVPFFLLFQNLDALKAKCVLHQKKRNEVRITRCLNSEMLDYIERRKHQIQRRNNTTSRFRPTRQLNETL